MDRLLPIGARWGMEPQLGMCPDPWSDCNLLVAPDTLQPTRPPHQNLLTAFLNDRSLAFEGASLLIPDPKCPSERTPVTFVGRGRRSTYKSPLFGQVVRWLFHLRFQRPHLPTRRRASLGRRHQPAAAAELHAGTRPSLVLGDGACVAPRLSRVPL